MIVSKSLKFFSTPFLLSREDVKNVVFAGEGGGVKDTW